MKRLLIAVPVLLAAAGCATTPTGPSVLVLPGTGKPFDQFNRDEVYCRDYALRALGGKAPGKASTDSTVATAAAGTAIGALAGSESGRYAGSSTQTRYDNAYIQCMYGLGHRVPVPAGLYGSESRPVSAGTRSSTSTSTGTAHVPPPPPPGNPPPPPPGVR